MPIIHNFETIVHYYLEYYNGGKGNNRQMITVIRFSRFSSFSSFSNSLLGFPLEKIYSYAEVTIAR